ncbi:hypothetical protein CEXT_488231 [Caerostris extrusa]|uniref:Maturase K n=1 Tax=Caerostris extrusa TaxID=172846 RepID=A0AAV4XC92_CAEEX|nr:hypothetical protein CEXT_488231 [Caerostris extrusa]
MGKDPGSPSVHSQYVKGSRDSAHNQRVKGFRDSAHCQHVKGSRDRIDAFFSFFFLINKGNATPTYWRGLKKKNRSVRLDMKIIWGWNRVLNFFGVISREVIEELYVLRKMWSFYDDWRESFVGQYVLALG